MEIWLTILSAIVFLTVIALTTFYFKRNEKSMENGHIQQESSPNTGRPLCWEALV